jgi:ribulose-phosphate 3-epimerase
LIEKDRVHVAPSILSADFGRLGEEIAAVEEAGADFHHIDVMDGHFVENITFGPKIVGAISRLASKPLITHLMISDPAGYAPRFIEAGSDVITFHLEAPGCRHKAVIDSIHGLDCAAGIALNPDTPLSKVEHLLGGIELLLIMSVFPGFGGQEFIGSVVDKIKQAAALKADNGYSYLIEVDGGVTPDNAEVVRSAGAGCLVAGTAIYKSEDYRAAISGIRG